MKIGDIVEINGVRRMITRIDGDKYFSTPYTEEKPVIETIKVEKVVKRKKKNDDLA